MRIHTAAVAAVAICLSGVMAATVQADDGPTYQHDNRRSGVTAEKLRLPLHKLWEYVCPERPQTAWSGPAKWDAFAKISVLKSMRNFDPVFYTTTAQGCVFFGSSVDDAVHCLDLRTGAEKWACFTNGPIRVPPSVHDGRLYFGSDDGCVYCLRADDGALVWRYEVSPEAGKVPFNGKLISLSPCRTGVLVQDGKAFFLASLLPWERTYLCALDAETGSVQGTGLYRRAHENMTAQGPIIASPTRLYVSQGRQTPLIFDCAGGRVVQTVGGSGFGGVFGLLTEDSMFIHGYGQNHRSEGELRFFGGEKTDLLVTFPHATSIVIRAGIVYVHADGRLHAFDRDKYVVLQGRIDQLQELRKGLQKKRQKSPANATEADRKQWDDQFRSAGAEIAELEQAVPSCFLWRVPSDCPLTLILAGDTLLAGGLDKVAAYDRTSGRQLWTTPLEGGAYGLAVARSALLVSTDLGRIVCFSAAD